MDWPCKAFCTFGTYNSACSSMECSVGKEHYIHIHTLGQGTAWWTSGHKADNYLQHVPFCDVFNSCIVSAILDRPGKILNKSTEQYSKYNTVTTTKNMY